MRTTASRGERARRLHFKRLVARTVRRLPPDILALLDNVEIVIEDEPAPAQRARAQGGQEVFGLYEGTPRTARDSAYSMVLPDKITIFRKPIERHCATPADIAREVQVTIIHELAHHLGIDEDRLAELGWD